MDSVASVAYYEFEMSDEAYSVSVVVPLYNEVACVDELHRRISDTLKQVGRVYEIVFVNDGSTDGTLERLHAIQSDDGCVKVVDLRGNGGQTVALAAGFDHANGGVVIPMDGDLQHLPEEIPLFIDKIDAGYDIVSGWRQHRKEGLLLRRIPSLIANKLIRFASGIAFHDFGTTFKAYRREVIEPITLYGDFHRFIPVFAKPFNVKMTEVPIAAPSRETGRSSYGIGRTWTVFFDVLRIRFLLSFLSRPLQFFGSAGFVMFMAGTVMMLILLKEKYLDSIAIMADRGPFFITAVFLLLAGVQSLSLGFLGEMITRVYHEGRTRTLYSVREIRGRGIKAG